MRRNKVSEIVSLFTELIRFRLSFAVAFSSVTGYFIFNNSIGTTFWFLTSGVFLLASGSSVLNQFSETRYDALMGRTMHRPLPGKKINRNLAFWLAIMLICSGSVLLLIIGISTALLGFLCVFLYNFVYTSLKRVTSFAIIPGSLVGAIPPLIGFEAAGGGLPDSKIIIFSSFMFFWQLPHFWLILLKYRKEYETAGFISISHFMKENQIRILVFLWVLVSSALLLLFSVTGAIFNPNFNFILIPLNIIFILIFYFILFGKEEKRELSRAFVLINSFSLLIMFLFIINSFLS